MSRGVQGASRKKFMGGLGGWGQSEKVGGGAGGSRASRGVWCLGGVQGVPGKVQAIPEVLGKKQLKTKKTRKTLRNCMASLQHPGFCAGGSSRPNGSAFGAGRGPLPRQ